MSLGLAQARPFRVTESTPQLGHVDAVSSAVTTCTTGLRTHPTPLAGLPDPRAKQTRSVRHQIPLNMVNVRTLEQARDLTL